MSAQTTRKKILASAVTLFRDSGYHATSVQEITEYAGVTKGAFYYHFREKSDVLRVIHDEFIEHGLADVRQVVRDSGDATELIRSLMISLMRSIEEFQDAMIVFFAEWRRLDEDAFEQIRHKRDALEDLIVDALAEHIDKGELRWADDPRVLALGIIGMCSFAYQWFSPSGSMRAPAIGNAYATALLHGLLGDPTLDRQD